MAWDKESQTPLHYNVSYNKGSTAVLDLLSKRNQMNAIDAQGRNPLHYATMNNMEYTVVKELLRYGVNVYRKDIQGRTPLHYAAINSNEPAGIHALLLYGADPNMKDMHGRTPLHYSIVNNRKLTIVQELLSNGANVNVSDDQGYTPLYLAADSEHRSLDVIKELLKFGAKIHIGRDEFWPFYRYCTPLDKAMYKRDIECAKLLSKISLLKNFDIDCKKCVDLDRYVEYSDHSELLSYVYLCFCELVKMASDKIFSNITLYQLVTKENKLVKPLYDSDSSIKQRILSNYPIYQDVIIPSLNVCLERGNILNKLEHIKISCRSCATVNDNSVSKEIILNFDCIYKLSQYLRNSELLNIITAFDIQTL